MTKLKTLALASIVALPFLIAAPANASNDDTAYFLGGVIGGLVLGDALKDHRRHDSDYEVYERPRRYHRRCWITERWEWNPYTEDYELVPYKICKRVRR